MIRCYLTVVELQLSEVGRHETAANKERTRQRYAAIAFTVSASWVAVAHLHLIPPFQRRGSFRICSSHSSSRVTNARSSVPTCRNHREKTTKTKDQFIIYSWVRLIWSCEISFILLTMADPNKQIYLLVVSWGNKWLIRLTRTTLSGVYCIICSYIFYRQMTLTRFWRFFFLIKLNSVTSWSYGEIGRDPAEHAGRPDLDGRGHCGIDVN